MNEKSANFAKNLKVESAMAFENPLKLMTALAVTIFVSLSAFATDGGLPKSKKPGVASSKSNDQAEARGGDGSGGADSVEDAKGRRSLLDLVEKDELEYFDHLYDFNQKSIREKLIRLYFTYFLANRDQEFGRCPQIPYKYWQVTGGHENFVQEFLSAYGIGKISSQTFILCPQTNNSDAYEVSLNGRPQWKLSNSKTLKWAFTDLPLESIDDEGEIRISRPNSKRQLAIQNYGVVVINRAEFDLLDSEGQKALFTHEALLYAVKVLNPDLIKKKGTLPVRTYNRRLLKFFHDHDYLHLTRFPITMETVVEAFQELKIPVNQK